MHPATALLPTAGITGGAYHLQPTPIHCFTWPGRPSFVSQPPCPYPIFTSKSSQATTQSAQLSPQSCVVAVSAVIALPISLNHNTLSCRAHVLTRVIAPTIILRPSALRMCTDGAIPLRTQTCAIALRMRTCAIALDALRPSALQTCTDGTIPIRMRTLALRLWTLAIAHRTRIPRARSSGSRWRRRQSLCSSSLVDPLRAHTTFFFTCKCISYQ
ncbi:hypothetical protein DFH06DRAFT_1326784 [Mycena polygramma]|nr:hypothetical protein DFH06DRAFT_1326784 [Mycena polygramma]